MDKLGGTKQTQAQCITNTIYNAFVELTVSSGYVNSPNGYEPGIRVLQVRCIVGERQQSPAHEPCAKVTNKHVQ
jgi:hypothetical protein